MMWGLAIGVTAAIRMRIRKMVLMPVSAELPVVQVSPRSDRENASQNQTTVELGLIGTDDFKCLSQLSTGPAKLHAEADQGTMSHRVDSQSWEKQGLSADIPRGTRTNLNLIPADAVRNSGIFLRVRRAGAEFAGGDGRKAETDRANRRGNPARKLAATAGNP